MSNKDSGRCQKIAGRFTNPCNSLVKLGQIGLCALVILCSWAEETRAQARWQHWSFGGLNAEMHDMLALSSDRALAVGAQGTVLLGSNEARTWSVQHGRWDLPALRALGRYSSKLLAVGDSSYALESIDEGMTWQPVQLPFKGNYRSIDSRGRYLAIGTREGLVQISGDSGQTFRQVELGSEVLKVVQTDSFTIVSTQDGRLVRINSQSLAIEVIEELSSSPISAGVARGLIVAFSGVDSLTYLSIDGGRSFTLKRDTRYGGVVTDVEVIEDSILLTIGSQYRGNVQPLRVKISGSLGDNWFVSDEFGSIGTSFVVLPENRTFVMSGENGVSLLMSIYSVALDTVRELPFGNDRSYSGSLYEQIVPGVTTDDTIRCFAGSLPLQSTDGGHTVELVRVPGYGISQNAIVSFGRFPSGAHFMILDSFWIVTENNRAFARSAPIVVIWNDSDSLVKPFVLPVMNGLIKDFFAIDEDGLLHRRWPWICNYDVKTGQLDSLFQASISGSVVLSGDTIVLSGLNVHYVSFDRGRTWDSVQTNAPSGTLLKSDRSLFTQTADGIYFQAQIGAPASFVRANPGMNTKRHFAVRGSIGIAAWNVQDSAVVLLSSDSGKSWRRIAVPTYNGRSGPIRGFSILSDTMVFAYSVKGLHRLFIDRTASAEMGTTIVPVAPLSILGNPAQGGIVRLQLEKPLTDLVLYSASGELVHTVAELPTGSHELNLGDLASGMYFLLWRDGQEAGAVRVIVQH